MEGEPLRNGNPEVVLFRKLNVSHSYTSPAVVVKGWVSFHSWEANSLINGNPKVAHFSNYFSESETFHRRILGQMSSSKDGCHFSHVRGTPL